MTWRKLWVALAEAEAELGLPITQEQINEMKEHVETIDFAAAAEYEKRMQHDVMAHIHAFGDQCPSAKSIIHLGATSCFVTDNGDLIQIREALHLTLKKLKIVIEQLAAFALKYASLPCLGYTHFQPAQLTTVGKRACLWLQDFLIDLQEIQQGIKKIKFLGVKGATGTQASFLQLFDQNPVKVEKLDRLVTEKMGFANLFIISGQTYTRKQDVLILNMIAGVAISAHKFCTDLRLLSHLREIDEPFGKEQVGSSAMPHKRNPILSERVCSLARFVLSLSENPSYTAATQWLERTLDDSANRRLSISESFLATDAILDLLNTITSGLVVYPSIIDRHVKEELPFLATENILMESAKKGGNRQTLHEKLRQYSQTAIQNIKTDGRTIDLLSEIANDPAFPLTSHDWEKINDQKNYIGMSSLQVVHFLENEVVPIIKKAI